MPAPAPNIPNPDPSVVANERLAEAVKQLRSEIGGVRGESKGWINTLQLLLEEKIMSAEDKTASLDRVVQTRLAGSETALNAAMAASDKVVAKIEVGVSAVMTEMKAGFAKQIDSINEKIDDLKERMSESGGRSAGSSHMVSIIFAGVAAMGAVVSALVVVFRTPV
jgi:hypothetical protein